MESETEFKVGDWVLLETDEEEIETDWYYIIEIMKRPRQIKTIKKEVEMIEIGTGPGTTRINVEFTDGSSGQIRSESYRLATESEIKAEQLRKLFLK